MRFLVLLGLAASLAWSLGSKLLTSDEAATAVPKTELSRFQDLSQQVRTPDFVVTRNEDGFLARGTTERISWSMQLPQAARRLWQSDYKGSRTYYSTGYTGGAGFAPPTWLIALRFDERGRPVPFYIVTQGSSADIFDLDGTGPQILQQDYWGSFFEDPGLYVTTLYEQRGPYWYRVDGRHGSHTFPAFEQWSVITKEQPARLLARAPATKYSVFNATNDPVRGSRVRFVARDGAAVRTEPDLGCADVIVDGLSVSDASEARKIVPSQLTDIDSLITTKQEVVLTGIRNWPEQETCHASILWIDFTP